MNLGKSRFFLEMKNLMLMLTLALASSCAFAESASTIPQVELFRSSFEDYTPGSSLCDTGAVNGTWGEVPTGAAIAVVDEARAYMSCSAPDSGLTFSPYSISSKKVSSAAISIRASGYEDMSRLDDPIGARAAFAIHSPLEGETRYMGWVCSQQCWTNLYPISGAASPVLGSWQEVMVKFLKADNGSEYVQYWLKRESDGSYVPLKTSDGVSWILAGESFNAMKRGKVGVYGEGEFEWLSGEECRRGLIVGVGSWYDFLFAESIYVHSKDSGWSRADDPSRTISDAKRSYLINVEEGAQPVAYVPSRTHSKDNVEVTEFEVEFSAANEDETIPETACARVRLVEQVDGTCRFVCLAGGQWKTKDEWRIDSDAKYTVEISLDNSNRTVSYRYKEGYGLEGGEYRDLFIDEPMLPAASGKTMKIDFEGAGVVHEIRGKNK